MTERAHRQLKDSLRSRLAGASSLGAAWSQGCPKGAVLQIQIRIRIHVFLGLLDPDPLVGMDPDPALDPSITKQK